MSDEIHKKLSKNKMCPRKALTLAAEKRKKANRIEARREANRIAQRNRRANFHVRMREQERNTAAKRAKRQNQQVRVVKQPRDTAAKRAKRLNPQMPKGNREVYSHLIQEVQSRECLYVPTHPQYKDRQKLETEWAEIGRILGVSGYVAKKTWQNLRSSYTRCLASEKSSNLMGSGRKSTWYLKDQMEFLREYMSTMAAFDMGRGSNCFDDLDRDHSGFDDMNRDHNSLDDMGPTTEELVNSYIKEEAREQEESTNDSASSSYFSTPVLPTAMKRQKMSYPHQMSDSPSTTAATETLWKIMSSEGDDDLVFFKGLLPTVRQLSDQNNRKFKHSISNYLFELLEAQESPSEPSPKPLQIE